MVSTTAQLHSTKPELRFCAVSNPSCGVSEICDGEDLWQWSWLKIRLNIFHRSTIPQKQLIIITCRGKEGGPFIKVLLAASCLDQITEEWSSTMMLKFVCAIFYQNFISYLMIALKKLAEMFFILSKKLFLFSRNSDFCISIFPSFSHCQSLL